VGGSKATVKHYFSNNIEILLAEHRVPLRHAIRSHRGQWQTVRRRRLQGLLFFLGTKLCFASVYHPQSNGAVERANGVIFTGIKRNITNLPKSKWAEELSRVIWSHNTTTSRTTQFSPFKLLYGEEAMLPEELCLGTWRDIPSSDEALKTSVPNIEEVRLQVGTNLSSYQKETRRWKKQEDSTEVHTVGRPGATQDPEGKAEGQDAWQVGRSIHSNRDIERSGLQVASVERRRRALHVECGHAPEVLCLKPRRDGNPLYIHFLAFVSFMLRRL
jgi:hypothetical protein